MEVKITKTTGIEWYKDCIGRVFRVQSESRKGGKGRYVVRLNQEDRYLMNSYPYGWVDKEHCEIYEQSIDEVPEWLGELIYGEV